MFDFDQLEQMPMMQGMDPTPDDGDITDIDWMQIGLDRLIFPVLSGMLFPVVARLFPTSAIPVSLIGGFVLPGLAAMAMLSHPRNKFKWIFTLLAYTLGLVCGSWDWIVGLALQDSVLGGLVLVVAFVVATAVCLVVKGVVRNG